MAINPFVIQRRVPAYARLTVVESQRGISPVLHHSSGCVHWDDSVAVVVFHEEGRLNNAPRARTSPSHEAHTARPTAGRKHAAGAARGVVNVAAVLCFARDLRGAFGFGGCAPAQGSHERDAELMNAAAFTLWVTFGCRYRSAPLPAHVIAPSAQWVARSWHHEEQKRVKFRLITMRRYI